mmetsp:Transcript_62294/g.103580  ORF Transcript_62294/g.103580 Transcript_62294/m.103580 type:complete len:110 (+) Transcript_62294:178-507(+)|eukprot:CAMPEP_0119313652 /NCGR_PEP_ID=MMETSP1333-20130426/29868_1 /TAXON_ID=418940 /ORGANISM="Scyphosphaera apsteinii, Strain RCC1455" /LENGTH=109 /DNA_ID=CAMNT_0007318527 /DNA_START=178 /DNA_END=510 /DNA_ORIENTATION=+
MAMFTRLAGLSGASGIGAAAYGAHGLKAKDPSLAKSYDNAQKMHMLNSVMLAVVPRLPRPRLTGSLFVAGSALFCGSCYAVALTGDRSYGRLAPAGGFTLIAAWLTLVL